MLLIKSLRRDGGTYLTTDHSVNRPIAHDHEWPSEYLNVSVSLMEKLILQDVLVTLHMKVMSIMHYKHIQKTL